MLRAIWPIDDERIETLLDHTSSLVRGTDLTQGVVGQMFPFDSLIPRGRAGLEDGVSIGTGIVNTIQHFHRAWKHTPSHDKAKQLIRYHIQVSQQWCISLDRCHQFVQGRSCRDRSASVSLPQRADPELRKL